MNLATQIRNRMCHICGILGAGALLCGAAAYTRTPQPAQSTSGDQGRISVVMALVVLPVRLTGAKGDFVSGLKQEQFRVYEDRRQQPITLFRQEDTPVTVA